MALKVESTFTGDNNANFSVRINDSIVTIGRDFDYQAGGVVTLTHKEFKEVMSAFNRYEQAVKIFEENKQ